MYLPQFKVSTLTKLIQEHPIVIILFVASLLRFWGIWHGYPYSYYPDEQHFVKRAVALGSGDLNPHWFHKPAFLMYLLFFEYAILFVAGRVFGVFKSVEDFAVYYVENEWPFILIGRITITIFGIATIYVVYKIGERIWSRKVGLYGAILLSLCYGHVFSGQDVKADVPATFFTVVSGYFLLTIASNNFKTRNYLYAASFAGLGTATKYYSIVLLPLIFGVNFYEVVIKRKVLKFNKFLLALCCFWSVYFIASPYNFIDPLGRVSTFGSIVNLFNKLSPIKIPPITPLEGTPEWGGSTSDSVKNYLEVFFAANGVGVVIGMLVLLSLVYVFVRPTLKSTVLVSFPLLFSAISIVMAPSLTKARHQIIIYPFLSIAVGIAISALVAYFNRERAVHLVLSLLLIFPTVTILKNNLYISRKNTLTIAKYWIEDNLPKGTKILLDRYSPVLNMSEDNLRERYNKSKSLDKGQFTTHLERYYHYKLQAVPNITYDIELIEHLWWRPKEVPLDDAESMSEFDKDFANPLDINIVKDYEYYERNGFLYVVTSDRAFASYIKPNSEKGKNFPSYKRFYSALVKRAKLIKEFDPQKLKAPGPKVFVFKIT